MNFLNLLTSGFNLLNFNLTAVERNNTSLFKPQDLSAASAFKQSAPAPELLLNMPLQQQQQSPQGLHKNEHAPKDPIIVPAVLPPKQNLLEEIIMNQQKELFNQYMFNLQLLKQSTLVPPPASPVITSIPCQAAAPSFTASPQLRPEDEHISHPSSDEHKNILRKKIKKNNSCGHADKPHYAKGMCNNCYHKYGRTKKPMACPHEKLYAAGLCQNCYINKYNKDKRIREQAIQKQESGKNTEEIQSEIQPEETQK